MDGGLWTVAPIHLANLLSAVRDRYGSTVRSFVFSPDEADRAGEYARTVGADGTIHYAYPRRGSVDWLRNWFSRHVQAVDVLVQHTLEAHDVHVAFCTDLTMSYGRIGTMCWLPDFQHVGMPEMFDAAECARRNRRFLLSSRLATRTIVTSEAVRRDFLAFAPTLSEKVRVLRPASDIPDWIYDLNPKTVVERYNLPEKFIYMPNQLWKHKNHELVLQALKSLNERGLRVSVVCTGNLVDHRHPQHAPDLFRKLSAWGLREQVIHLGLVARQEVLLLMRQSVCVLNPALFEGWGYSVDEARSLGKRVAVSDIAAHREQDPAGAVFFDPRESDDLAARLAAVWEDGTPGPDAALEAAARQDLQRRRTAYAEQFVALAQETAEVARR
jgi:glycosyltransferase involved in cell wall biosynthesis